MRFKTYFAAVFCLAFASLSLCEMTAQDSFVVMELNAENYFDAINDSVSDDDDFTPQSARAWTWRKFRKKTNMISKLIAAAGGDKPVDLIALCEVESDSVMEYLTKRSALRRLHYDYLITHGADVRGMNVALAFNPRTFKLLAHSYIRPDFENLPHKRSRDILHATGMILTGDTLDVFVCHLPSRLDKRKTGRAYRWRIAAQLKHMADSVIAIRQRPNIIMTGDFNDTPYDKTMTDMLGAIPIAEDVSTPQNARLYNLMANKNASRSIRGTYYYKGTWEILDNFVVNGRMLSADAKMHISCSDCRIFAPAFLLVDTPEGLIPYRTYKGYKFINGFSDHLPIVAEFFYSW